jgi:rhamnosyltransferase
MSDAPVAPALPSASVIIRTLDAAEHLEPLAGGFRRQSVPCEIVVVDSGSTDATLELAERLADRVHRLPPGTYTPGRALNAGAAIAAGEVHVAFSAHCRLPDDGWLERSLSHYADPRVAATNGTTRRPDGTPLTGVFVQDAAHGRAVPTWGYSNHAASWRAAVWNEKPFDESLPTAEDRIWSWDVLDAGWRIVFASDLWVDMQHRWRIGTVGYYRRCRQEEAVLAGHAQMPPYRMRELLRQWLVDVPDDDRPAWFHRVNPRRLAGLAGAQAGRRKPYRPAGDGA